LLLLRTEIVGLIRKNGLFCLLICIAVLSLGIISRQEVKNFEDGEEGNHYAYHTRKAEIDAEAGITQKGEIMTHLSWEGLVGGQLAFIRRGEVKTQVIMEEIEPEVQFMSDLSLPQGTIHIEDEGSVGLVERVYQLTLVDGQEKHRELLEVKVLQEAKPRLILQGTAPRSLGVARDSLRPGGSWQGRASWYGGGGDGFHGRKTASGEIFDSNALTAAHPFLPFGTIVSVTHMDSDKEVVVRINDRGPFIRGRIIDLSRRAAELIGMRSAGVAEVIVKVITLPN
jgi:rare lipoprotein A